MQYQDRGHYYVDEVLIDGLTMAKCREAGGIPSVTTKLANWSSPSLKFWAIEENLNAAYKVLNGMEMDRETFDRLVKEEFYRVHNHLHIGTLVHDIMDKLIKNSVKLSEYSMFFREYADPKIIELLDSVESAYEWFLLVAKNGVSEKIIYDKDRLIAGTADFSGFSMDDGKLKRTGIDWKTKYIKKHPGYSSVTKEMKSFKIRKEDSYKMQLGAYGAVERWEIAYNVFISSNPDVPGIQVQKFSTKDLVDGYQAFHHISKTYDILNGFVGKRGGKRD
jgi:hypothetical protein